MSGAEESPQQRAVLVTGGAGGIGSAIIERFVAGGWKTCSVDLTNPDSSRQRLSVQADLRSAAACRDAVSEAARLLGRLDAVVNAAGVWHEGDTAATTEAEFDRVIDVNLKGTFFVSAASIPHLEPTRGCIVNISSDAGIQGNSGAAAYCASKGGVSVFTKALALELAPRGIRVNAICPGDVDSPMLRGQAESFGDGDARRYYDRLLAGYPQGRNARFITTKEVAEFVWFICQSTSSAITGANLSIDFGLSAGIFPRD